MLLNNNVKKMINSLLIRLVYLTLCFLLIVCPASINAGEIDASTEDSNSSKIIESPKEMTQKQMNDLFGEDPYLGQTSYLQSPESFSQTDKSKQHIAQ